ncbi:hypothetical protein [Streptomyces carminius]|uniref:hypothetical protein n=1 Tax=Streptomyces carminius TaxID=2665496 RepID=UPI0011B5CF9E|nr:hypothetical protein [Streptomyces carminius]
MDVPIWIFLLPLLTFSAAVFAANGSRRAFRLARAARRKSGVRVRYVLLHSHTSSSPWLVFFPGEDEEGEDAGPMGCLRLSYGPVRQYFRDLPRPVGESLLMGNLRDGEVVVPWIGANVVWPAGSFREANSSDQDQVSFFSELTASKPFSP